MVDVRWARVPVQIDVLPLRRVHMCNRRDPIDIGHFRLLDIETGECVMITFWETAADADASRDDREYYLGGQQKLWPFVRYGMFKTEHCDSLTLAPVEAGGTPAAVTSPYARFCTIMMNRFVPTGIPSTKGIVDPSSPRGRGGAANLYGRS